MRRAESNDIDRLYEIYSHESVAPNMGFDPCSGEEFKEIFSELNFGGVLTVYEREQKIVAACKIIHRGRRLRHSAYIGALAVHYGCQGMGVGKEFFGKILDDLKAEGFSRIELLVAADNKLAIKFFKGFGFAIEGTHKNYFSRAGSDQLFDEHTMAWVKQT
jgi:L-phenylalanine/L-methionine N-acetyltransferase